MDVIGALSEARRNKAGPALIVFQIAITLAILCNALFIMNQRVTTGSRPTGVDESNLLVIWNQWVESPDDLGSRVQTDVAALRSIPGVIDAFVTDAIPLGDSGLSWSLNLSADKKGNVRSAMYFGDEHALDTLGVKLVAGRNFRAEEIGEFSWKEGFHPPAVIIVSKSLAEKLFPGGAALGQSVFFDTFSTPTQIIGIVEHLQVPWVSASGWGAELAENSDIVPLRIAARDGSGYVLRARPGRLAGLMHEAPTKLRAVNRARIMTVTSFAEARARVFHDDRGLTILLGVVCAALLIVTAFGIVGLTSYWVVQRRRQIGIRRALGATRMDIIRSFQVENLLIAGLGVLVGVTIAIVLNLWMVSNFETARLQGSYLVTGSIVLLLLGQAAVLWPAVRAAAIPPAIAARSV
jgi:putative ABC transport system permease protein